MKIVLTDKEMAVLIIYQLVKEGRLREAKPNENYGFRLDKDNNEFFHKDIEEPNGDEPSKGDWK